MSEGKKKKREESAAGFITPHSICTGISIMQTENSSK